jgi:apolipoprotein N-acyltransferase
MRAWLANVTLAPKTALLVLFAAGALVALGFAPFHYWPVLFISLPILYGLLIQSASRAQALWRGFAFGYGFFMAGTWWIGNALLVDAAKFGWMMPFSVLGLSAVMALWFLPLAYGVYCLRARMTPLLFTAVWVLVELARSVGIFGFPWNLVGYMSFASLEVAQLASLIGTYGLSLLLVWVALLPVYWLVTSRRVTVMASIIAFALCAASYGYGHQRLQTPVQFTDTVIRIVQPNIPQEVKGTEAGRDIAIRSLDELTTLSPKGPQPDVIIWPETAYPFTVRAKSPLPLPKFKGLLISGAVRAEGTKPNVRIWNSMFVATAEGKILATYDKHQLVPFGEFVPLRSVLPLDKITPGDIDFSRGDGLRTVAIEGGVPPFSPQICYEGIFPWLAADAANRPKWMLNLTNDGWYGDSSGPYQHFEMVRMRAIEQGLPMVRVANSGISAVVDAYGGVRARLSLNQKAILQTILPRDIGETLYAKAGSFLIFTALLPVLLMQVLPYLLRKK